MDFSWRQLLAIGLLLTAQAVSHWVVDATLIMLAFWMLRGPEQALQSLSLLVVIKFLNPALVTFDGASAVLLVVVPLLAGLRILPLVRFADLRLVGPVVLFSAGAALCSIVSSHALAISLLKAGTFGWIIATVLVAWKRLQPLSVIGIGTWMRSVAIAVASLSLVLLLAQPAAANYRGLFRGVLSHPQALGAFLAPFVAAHAASWVFEGRRIELREALILSLLAVTMLLTRSRTAAVAASLGCLVATVGGRSTTAGPQGTGELARAAGVVLAATVAFLALEAIQGGALSSVSGFLLKRGEQHLGTAFAASRGSGIIAHLHNFMTSPIVGHGFGVDADAAVSANATTVAGIPVSAPTEKGFLPSAVLEETGLLGGGLFAYMIYVLCRTVWHRASRPMVAVLFASLFVNLGEAILLSPGGMGLHAWLLIGLALQTATFTMLNAPSSPSVTASANPAGRRYVNLIE
jgi:hypothetical protein